MRTRVMQVGLLGLLLALGPRGASAEVMRWQVDGETREAIVYSPATPRWWRRGRRSSCRSTATATTCINFQRTDLYMQPGPTRSSCTFRDSRLVAASAGGRCGRGDVDRDLKLVDVALASLRRTYTIDDDRIYATGFSNGGMFTYLLWAERPGVFAAYAPVAGRLSAAVRPKQPSPLFHVAGEGDRVVSFSDQGAAIEAAIDVNGVGATRTGCGEGCTVYGLRNARTRHDMDSSWCPRLSAWNCRANRVFFSRALPRALIG